MANHVSFYITSDSEVDFTKEFKMHTYTRTYDETHSWEVTEPLELCLLYTSPSPRDVEESRMPSSA